MYVFMNWVNSRIFSGFLPVLLARTSASIPGASSIALKSSSISLRFDFRTTELGKVIRSGACFKQSGLCLLNLYSLQKRRKQLKQTRTAESPVCRVTDLNKRDGFLI